MGDSIDFVRTVLLTFAVATCFSIDGAGAEEKTRQPNILWIVAENMGPDLGCYDTPLVRTPRVDRLAAEGMRYEWAFDTCPVCSPSRSAFMTGMYQTTIGAHHHRSHRLDDLPTVERTAKGWNASEDSPWSGSTHPPVIDPDEVQPPPYYPNHPVTRKEWAGYLDSVCGMDTRVGVILDKLEEDGLADDTVVIFFADNGRLELRGLDWCYDSGDRVPLIIRWPKNFSAPSQYKPGSVSRQLVSLIDVTATTLDIAGVKKPENMQGRILLGPHADAPRTFIVSARDRTDDAVNRIRSIRTRRYRYTRNFMPEKSFLALHRYKYARFPILKLMYGHTPEVPSKLRSKLVSTRKDAVDGLATRTIVRLQFFDDPESAQIELMVYLPNKAGKPVPMFLGLSFSGNASVEHDPTIPLPTGWMRPKQDAVVNNRATETLRGISSDRWPIRMAIERGYGVATFYYGDVEPDHIEGWRDGLRGYLLKRAGRKERGPKEWGALGAWAWGLSRAMDYLETLSAVDAQRVVVFGHSRLGKTALWAGAQDRRFAIVLSNNSGEGGASLARRNYGENIAFSIGHASWRYCDRFREFADRHFNRK